MDWNELVKGTFLELVGQDEVININREEKPEKGVLLGEMTSLEKAFYTMGRQFDKKSKKWIVKIFMAKLLEPDLAEPPADLVVKVARHAQKHEVCIAMVWTLIRERFPEAGNLSLCDNWEIYETHDKDDREKEISSDELHDLKTRLDGIIGGK
jgi:hypothetical protein